MTKKFWNEWQTRIGETKTIVLIHAYDKIRFGKEEYKYTLVSAKFIEDTVELVLNTKFITSKSINGNAQRRQKNEQKTITLNRKEIKTVEFWQN